MECAQEALRPFDLNDGPERHPVGAIWMIFNYGPEDILALSAHFKQLEEQQFIVPLLEWFLREIRDNQYLIAVDIQKYMKEYEASGNVDTVHEMLRRVLEWWEAWGNNVPCFSPYVDGVQAYRRSCTIHLNSSLPPAFRGAFRALLASTFPSESAPMDVERSKGIFATLNALGLLTDHEHLVGSTLRDFITQHLMETCKGEWETMCWPVLKDWYAAVVAPWIEVVYVRSWMKREWTKAIFDPLNAKYLWHMCEALAKLRISEIFDIIVDYPASSPAIADLKECLFQTGTRKELVQSLRTANKKRLLHPGADTKDIINLYVSTIRCLRVLDPMGSLLFSVADPIRQYLRERPDTIRTIVQNLIDPKSEFTSGEDGEVKPLQDTTYLADDYGDFGWMPEPAYADAAFRTTRATDIISTLVSIYDSRDIFVKELQVLLAKRLLEIKNKDYDPEIRNLEILKLRFGDAPLQVCDVMMKDITDSRRADQHIKNARKVELEKAKDSLPYLAPAAGNEEEELPLHATIISRLFWPSMPSTSLIMPGKFRKYQEEYARRFSEFKPDRKIRFIPNLGTVSLELELQDRTLNVEATPLQAAIVDLFSSKDTWVADELAVQLGNLDIPSVDKALEFWMDQGVVSSLGNKQYKLLEVAEDKRTVVMRPARRSSLNETPAATKMEEQQAEQMRVYWQAKISTPQFIQGMLTNFPSLPTDRIHTMLKFAPNYDRTREQLARFLEALKRSERSSKLPLSTASGVANVLIFYSSVIDGQLWCPDCRFVESIIKTTFENSADRQGIIVYVGDQATWRNPNNTYRKGWKISSVPTLIRLNAEGKEESRLVDSEITLKRLTAFLN
ncbi:hypothetical protein FRB98_007764 [Tulasnella sp. 332]|nr:hypothetical protein FRB98_007764 [Tulasnella sp. 332]